MALLPLPFGISGLACIATICTHTHTLQHTCILNSFSMLA